MKIEQFAYSFRCVGKSDRGLFRKENQDRILLNGEAGLFAVSDGMGGILCGGESSTFVVEALPILVDSFRSELDETDASCERVLSKAVRVGSECLYRKGNQSGRIDFGATVAAVRLHHQSACVCWMGDSRVYLLTKSFCQLVRLTTDMNIAGLLLEAGEISEKTAETHPGKSKLTAFVGMPSPADVRVTTVRLAPGDLLLLCSDGLHGMVKDDELAELLKAPETDLEALPDKLINQANQKGGRDNISVLLIKIDER